MYDVSCARYVRTFFSPFFTLHYALNQPRPPTLPRVCGFKCRGIFLTSSTKYFEYLLSINKPTIATFASRLRRSPFIIIIIIIIIFNKVEFLKFFSNWKIRLVKLRNRRLDEKVITHIVRTCREFRFPPLQSCQFSE